VTHLSIPEHLARVFLSYAREDDKPFVERLHADLTKAGFTVWFDRESLISRGLPSIKRSRTPSATEVDRVVYVGGPKAALSAYGVRNGSSPWNAITSSSPRSSGWEITSMSPAN